jgi:hypothetical protein
VKSTFTTIVNKSNSLVVPSMRGPDPHEVLYFARSWTYPLGPTSSANGCRAHW